MRPFQQAEPNVQMMLVDRAGRAARTLARPLAGDRPGARRSAVSDALAALALTRLLPFAPIARTDLGRARARTA